MCVCVCVSRFCREMKSVRRRKVKKYRPSRGQRDTPSCPKSTDWLILIYVLNQNVTWLLNDSFEESCPIHSLCVCRIQRLTASLSSLAKPKKRRRKWKPKQEMRRGDHQTDRNSSSFTHSKKLRKGKSTIKQRRKRTGRNERNQDWWTSENSSDYSTDAPLNSRTLDWRSADVFVFYMFHTLRTLIKESFIIKCHTFIASYFRVKLSHNSNNHNCNDYNNCNDNYTYNNNKCSYNDDNDNCNNDWKL